MAAEGWEDVDQEEWEVDSGMVEGSVWMLGIALIDTRTPGRCKLCLLNQLHYLSNPPEVHVQIICVPLVKTPK